MKESEELRQRVLTAIAHEHLLHQRMQEQREQADRWQRRAELAARIGDQEMAAQALERYEHAAHRAAAYEQQYLAQAEAMRQFKPAMRSAPAAPPTEVRLLELQLEDRLDRDLADLKAKLGNPPEGQAL